MYTPSQKRYHAGFTLIEMMVSLMLFTIVVLAVVGSLYTVNTSARKAQAMGRVMDNLGFAVESISRTVRTGNAVSCIGVSAGVLNCPFQDISPGTGIQVDSTLGGDHLIEYRRYITTGGTGVIQKRTQESGLWGNWVSLTAPEIDVQQLSFYVDGADTDDKIQPQVQLFVKGVAVVGENTAPFAIQTYISQRATE
jgi:prepilin-type N-terminal cleavage/methylation domain-containing protein